MTVTIIASVLAALVIIGAIYIRGVFKGKKEQESINLKKGVENALEASKNRVERDNGGFDDVKRRLRKFTRDK